MMNSKTLMSINLQNSLKLFGLFFLLFLFNNSVLGTNNLKINNLFPENQIVKTDTSKKKVEEKKVIRKKWFSAEVKRKAVLNGLILGTLCGVLTWGGLTFFANGFDELTAILIGVGVLIVVSVASIWISLKRALNGKSSLDYEKTDEK